MDHNKSGWGFFAEVDQPSHSSNKPASQSAPSIPTNTRYASGTLYFGGPSTVGSPRAREKTFFDYFFSQEDVSLLCGELSVSRTLAEDLCRKGFMNMEHLREADFDFVLAIISEHVEASECEAECRRIFACAFQPLRRPSSPQQIRAGCSKPVSRGRDSDESVQTTVPAESTSSSEYLQGAHEVGGVRERDQDRRRLDTLSNGQEDYMQEYTGSVSGSSVTIEPSNVNDEELLFPMDDEELSSYTP